MMVAHSIDIILEQWFGIPGRVSGNGYAAASKTLLMPLWLRVEPVAPIQMHLAVLAGDGDIDPIYPLMHC